MRISLLMVMVLAGCNAIPGTDAGSGGGVGGGGTPVLGGGTGGGSTGGGSGGGSTGGGSSGGGGGSLDAGPDAGNNDAGADAGMVADAGRVREPCTTEANCTALDAGFEGCAALNASCIDGFCRAECGTARTCTTNVDAGCATCGGTEFCGFDGCIGPASGVGYVESTTCTAWRDAGVVLGSRLSIVADGCTQELSQSDAGLEGRFALIQNGTYLGDLPAFGGACTIMQVPYVGAQRMMFSCPRCEFMLRFD